MMFKFVIAVLAAVSQANAACVPCSSLPGPAVYPGLPAPAIYPGLPAPAVYPGLPGTAVLPDGSALDPSGVVNALFGNLQPTINAIAAQVTGGAATSPAIVNPATGQIVYPGTAPAPGQIVYPAPATTSIIYPAPAPSPAPIVYPAPAPGSIVYPGPGPAPIVYPAPAPAPGQIVYPGPGPIIGLPPVVPCPDAPTKVSNKPDVNIPLPLPSEIPVAKVCTCQKYSIKPALVPCAPTAPGPVVIPGTGTVVYPGTGVYPTAPGGALCCS